MQVNTCTVCDDNVNNCFVLFSTSQLTCLNLSNNRIQKLDDLAGLITKVPNLKTLNLSHNAVRLAIQFLE